MNAVRLSVACLVILLISVNKSAVAQKSDQVVPIRGSAISGKIVGTTPTQVTIDVRGTERPVNVNEIRRVTFAEDPPELFSGRAKVVAGKLQDGFDDLKQANPAAIERDLVRRDLQFYLAFCEGKLALSSGGDKTKASASMLAFVRAAPNSHHFFQAAELLGDLAVAVEDYEGAVRYYGAIATKAPWPEYQLRATMSEARAWVAQGDFVEAQKRFESVIANNSDTTESKRQKLLAQIGKGRCLAETSTPEEGIQMIEDVIDKNESSDVELFGRAYNALGASLLKAGKEKDALMAYLHVDVLFYADTEIHAESLYYLSKLWAATNKGDRADAARSLLLDRYAGSVWSNKE